MGYEVGSSVLRGAGVRGGPLDLWAGSSAGGRSGHTFSFLWPVVRGTGLVGVRRPVACRFVPHAHAVPILMLFPEVLLPTFAAASFLRAHN